MGLDLKLQEWPISRMGKAFAAAALLSGLLVFACVPPDELPLPNCVFHSLTGLGCMTCGMTRSLHALMHGNVTESIRYHLFGLPLALGMLFPAGLLLGAAVGVHQVKVARLWRVGFRATVPLLMLWLFYWGIRLVVGDGLSKGAM